jgi:AraC-like DNA-binding protein
MNIFGRYIIGCGMTDDEERVLRENGWPVATKFKNGEIEHKDYDGRFVNVQQAWDMYAPYIKEGYSLGLHNARGNRESRIEAYAKAVHKSETYYEFCFNKAISNDLLNEVVPVEWLNNARLMTIFGRYVVGCGMTDDEERVLRENGWRVATKFKNGEIEHRDYEHRFPNVQQFWAMYAYYIRDSYSAAINDAGHDRQKQIQAYAKAVHKAESYYQFCFDRELSNDLLNKVAPVDWLK